MQKFNGPDKNGTALISALFIMTLIAIAATAMSVRLQLDIYRTHLTILTDDLYLASQAPSFWAISQLAHAKKPFTVSDNQGKILDYPAKLMQNNPSMVIQSSLYDLQSRFNLNNLVDSKYLPFFANLLENPKLKLASAERKSIIEALRRWVSPYQPGRGNDELTRYYLQQKPPYLASNQFFQSPSESRLIRGISAANYLILADLITVLPEETPINLNTAPRLLLKGLGNGLKDSQVEKLLSARQGKGITNMANINPLLQKYAIRSEQVTIESQYFLCVTSVVHKDLSLIKYTVLKRKKNKQGKVFIQLISESLNTL